MGRERIAMVENVGIVTRGAVRLPVAVVLATMMLSTAMLACVGLAVGAEPLEAQLKRESAAHWATEARASGDAARGAIVFWQPHLACSRCHDPDGSEPGLGPNLAQVPRDTTDAYLVEAILEPSRAIRPEYRTLQLELRDGRTLQGLAATSDAPADADVVLLRDAARYGQLTRVPRAEIEEQSYAALSLMPAGQVNQLASVQQFLDLVRYVMELRDGGVERARALRPAASLLAGAALPEYETHLDHRRLIAESDDQASQRGEAIYRRVCANCHGTHDQAGSLPTSLRFAEGRFKNGADPYAMYQTITRGFGFMVPQNWMVPRQKYDVIHYIREAYLKPHNGSQWTVVDDAYLASLPAGDTVGPEPSNVEVWAAMDYGRCLMNTYEVPEIAGSSSPHGPNIAQKGIAVRLDPGPGGVSRGRQWMVLDHDTLRLAGAWSGGGFIDWHGIHFDGSHGSHPRLVGDVAVANDVGPGWARPVDGSWDDPRLVGRDGRRYGPLPRDWARYRGRYQFADQTIVSYLVGETPILERPEWLPLEVIAADTTKGGDAVSADRASVDEATGVFWRSFHIGPRTRPLNLRVATQASGRILERQAATVVFGAEGSTPLAAGSVAASLTGEPLAPQGGWRADEAGRLVLEIPAGEEPLLLGVWFAPLSKHERLARRVERVASVGRLEDLQRLTRGGPSQWPERVVTEIKTRAGDGPLVVEDLSAPEVNPWLAQTRLTGLDFLPADSRGGGADEAAVCSWDGDVWIVSGLRGAAGSGKLTWQRIATGLFQPLGLKVIDGQIFVTCRDQIVILRDLNGDRETDYYECFNNDHQVTEHFHEFAMGLQVDEEGNLYYAKSGRHALTAVVPHHGTLLRVSKDGSTTEILANGFRAANGVCLNPDGSFIVTDQEGFWNPKNRINWVTVQPGGPPKFYGNLFGYHQETDESDRSMHQPLCWITNEFDRSPAELLWIPPGSWGPLGGSLLNLSYGYGRVFVVPHERVPAASTKEATQVAPAGNAVHFDASMDDRLTMQGGMIALPVPDFPTGLVRGRFHPTTHDLYLAGMHAWAGSVTHPGGLYRIRYTGQPVQVPVELHARQQGVELRFSDPLDAESVRAENFALKAWSLRRTANYGSDHYDERTWEVKSASLAADRRTLWLEVPGIAPTWSYELRYSLRAPDGSPVEGTLHGTIHRLDERVSD
jgi:putative heme-binding domain-containing protein